MFKMAMASLLRMELPAVRFDHLDNLANLYTYIVATSCSYVKRNAKESREVFLCKRSEIGGSARVSERLQTSERRSRVCTNRLQPQPSLVHQHKPGAPNDSFQNFAARLGYGAGNLTDASRYSIEYLSRNRFQLEAMYRSSWICGKAVDSVAEDMTKRGIEINSEAEPGAVELIQEYWKTLKLVPALPAA